MMSALAIVCLVAVPVAAVVYATLFINTDRTTRVPHWSEYHWLGDDE